MELMDWKDIESGAESQIRDALKQQVIAKILLMHAEIKIKKLGGQTNQEIDDEAKKKRKDTA